MEQVVWIHVLTLITVFVHELSHYVFAFTRIRSLLIGYAGKWYRLIIGFRVDNIKTIDIIAPQFIVPLVSLLLFWLKEVTAVDAVYMVVVNFFMSVIDFESLGRLKSGEKSGESSRIEFKGIEIKLK